MNLAADLVGRSDLLCEPESFLAYMLHLCAGSAYAVAGPWWATRLGKTSFAARQCSRRGGDLVITVNEAEGRVDIAGGAVLVSEGYMYLDG